MIKTFIILGIGCFSGLWVAWPGITNRENWICAKEIAIDSDKGNLDKRTLISVTPKYLLNRNNLTYIQKIRFLGDTCFR